MRLKRRSSSRRLARGGRGGGFGTEKGGGQGEGRG